MKYTREDYIDKKCTHREYFSQWVDDSKKNTIKNVIGIKKLLQSDDEHLNDIPLKTWDSVSYGWGDSLSTGVCIAKEVAKQLIEENRK